MRALKTACGVQRGWTAFSVAVLLCGGGMVARAELAPQVARAELASEGVGSGVEPSLVALDVEEQQARGQLAKLGPVEERAQSLVRARGRVLYKMLRAGMLPAGGGLQAFFDHVMRVERVRQGLDHDVRMARNAADQKVALRKKLEEIATRRPALEAERDAEQKARAELLGVEDRRRAFDRAFQKSSGSGEYLAVYGGNDVGEGPDPERRETFASRKGRLPFPLAGRSEIKAVRREGAAGPGLEMRAPIGSSVRAVYPGRVAFADQYGPYGKMVILDHGDHYFTLLGNLGRVEVRVGDDVSVGARLGTVGDEGHGAMLYFEVRKGNDALDPSVWLGL